MTESWTKAVCIHRIRRCIRLYSVGGEYTFPQAEVLENKENRRINLLVFSVFTCFRSWVYFRLFPIRAGEYMNTPNTGRSERGAFRRPTTAACPDRRRREPTGRPRRPETAIGVGAGVSGSGVSVRTGRIRLNTGRLECDEIVDERHLYSPNQAMYQVVFSWR